MKGLSIFPPRASTFATELDALSGFELAVIVIMSVLIFLCVFIFAIKYRRRSDDEMPPQMRGSMTLEIFWSVVPLGVMLIMFGWGTKLYFEMFTPPRDAIDIYVTGKQWMWKVQYPGGQREINELHVPVGRPVKITLASEDVLHSFYIPAFRVKHDVVPGHYEMIWFEATEPGRYHLFCAEYCGTQHANMIGSVTAMSQADYTEWLTGSSRGISMIEQGAQRFQEHGCITCHALTGRCPPLTNVYGSTVRLADGRSVVADEAYIRESILNPNAKIVDGYKQDVMPVFQGQIDEEGILQLIAYVKSLSNPTQPERTRK